MKKTKFTVTFVFIAFIAVFAILLAVLPKSDYSENEKRVLQKFPELTGESLADGEFSEKIDTFTSDQFPFRDVFVGVNSYYDLLCGRNGASGVYKCADGYLAAAPEPLNGSMCESNVKVLTEFAKEKGLPSTMMIVPSTGYGIAEKLPSPHKEYHDDEIYDIAKKNVGETELIDLRDTFKENADKQIYYKTDHHVTTEGAYLMYKAFCEKRGIEPITDFSEKEVLYDFYGTNYSKSGLWFTSPDTVEIWHSANNYDYEVTVDDITSKDTYNSLYFYEHDKNMDKYPVFLNGNHAVTTVKNKNVKNGKRIMLIKDSFAHCFSTFLCENYEEVVLVDLRYYKGSVSDLLDEENINELLFLFGSDNLSGSSDIAWLS